MTAAPRITSIFTCGACLGPSLRPSILARPLKHEESPAREGEERRATERRRDGNEPELAGYLLGGPR